jgi:hypothetical protein
MSPEERAAMRERHGSRHHGGKGKE